MAGEAAADHTPAEGVQVASLDPRAGGLTDPEASSGEEADASAGVPLPSFRESVADDISAEVANAAPDPATVAVPVPRPRAPASANRRVASLEPRDVSRRADTATDAAPAADVRPRQRPAKDVPAALAYARQSAPGEDNAGSGGVGSFFNKLFNSGSAQLPGPGSKVAVYDIQSATVYLPGDRRLEAHSGLGHMQDNPRYVNQKNRGPTPPNIYNMVMRESLFHGVQAIRLLPADGRKKFNRDGLLAHSYMYVGGGDRSQSNGCVVFKNYDQFLKEFKRGRINRLIVVKSLDDLPTYMAAL
nr:tlde1 domain-containing protein [Aurantimonas sp. VKM B-3413]